MTPQTTPLHLSAKTVWAATPWVLTGTSIVIGLSALLAVIVLTRRERDPLSLYLVIGGAAAGLICEPLLGSLDHLWWPRNYPGPSVMTFGIRVPALIPFVYAFYLGLLGHIIYQVLSRGATRRKIWQLWAALAAVDFAFQLPAVNLKAYVYYGEQPFKLARLPLEGPLKNASAYMLIGALIWLLEPRLKGRSRAIMVLVPGFGYLAGALCCAWPWFLANAAHTSPGIRWIIGCVTFPMCALLANGIAAVAGTDSPARLDPALQST